VHHLIGLGGIAGFLLIAFLMSQNRRAIQWKCVIWGLAIQFGLAVVVLKWWLGRTVLAFLADVVTRVISFADSGAEFVFGWLVSTPDSGRYIFAFEVLPIVVFVSSLFSCLYYLGVMQWVVLLFARLMTRLMGVSGSESLAAAANVFMGQTEAPIIVAPYIPSMTHSELMALMTGGMATVSGAVLGGYIGLGINPQYLIAASVMAAPASLVMAKILVPETESSKTAGTVVLKVEKEAVNLIDAAARGAGKGMTLAINIAAMLLAFIALIYLANGLLGFAGRFVGLEGWIGQPLTLQLLLGYSMAPLALLMGVPLEDATVVGRLIGVKIVLNEFVAYTELVDLRAGLAERSELIATYALCGFANLGSIGIQIGGVGALAPSRRSDLARLGPLAVLGGSMASFMTASLAGLLS
jgi:CNT family concentrative nucleoside transporter